MTVQHFWDIIKRYSFNLRISGVLFLFLTCIGLARAYQHFYIIDVAQALRFGLWWHIPFNLFLWWSWFLFLPFMYWLTIRSGTSKSVGMEVLCYAVTPLVVVALRQLIATFIITTVLVGYMDFPSVLYQRLFANRWIWLDVFVYFVIVIGVYVVEFQKEERENELNLAKLQSQLVQSQLNALESQLRPHFLFNTLNTISTLILKADAKEAERMLLLLQNLLQTTVYENDQHMISFAEEMQFINQYLEIEKVRFQDKLVVQEEIDNDVLPATVPRFMLQPIVENAIYHAIAQKTSDGILRITANKEGEWLHVTVDDNGSGLSHVEKKHSKKGVGLKITRERLLRLFGSKHLLEFQSSPLGGLQVAIKIPLVLGDGQV
jgi:signal transduction histidine kinase